MPSYGGLGMNAPSMNSHVETISAALADLDRNGFAIVKNLFTDEQLDDLTVAMSYPFLALEGVNRWLPYRRLKISSS